MKGLIGFAKTTVIGGALYLVPIALVVLVLSKVHAAMTKVVQPIATALALHDIGGINAARLLAVVAILLVCFLAGLFAQTRPAKMLLAWLEQAILSRLPGYSAVAAIGEGVAHPGDRDRMPIPVLARIEDAWQLALLVEQIDENQAAVFVPGAPNPTSGSVYFMTNDRIRPAEMPLPELMKCIKGLGIGARQHFAGRL